MKAFAGAKFDVAKNWFMSLIWEENIVGKGEIAGYQHFLLFPQWFQKLSVLWLLKVRIM